MKKAVKTFLLSIGMLFVVSSGVFAAWDDCRTVQDVCTMYPATVTALFDALNLDYAGMGTVKTYVNAGNYPSACTALITYYKNKRGWIDAYRDISSSGYNKSSADNTLQDIYSFQGVTDTVPRNADGGLKWNHLGPNNDVEYGYFLNRHGEWYNLMTTYLGTGDTKYSAFLDELIRDWVIHNPKPSSNSSTVQWRVLEAGIRPMSIWPKVFYSFVKTGKITDAGIILMLSSFAEHGSYLRAYHVSNFNHATMELTGLVNIALAFPEFASSGEWYSHCDTRIVAELNSQFYPDGACKELTSHYHRITTGDFEVYRDICVLAGKTVSSAFRAKLEASWNYLAYCLRPNGFSPLNNDSDLDDNAARIIEAANEYGGRPDWKYIASNGSQGQVPDGYPSVVFPWAGHAVSRSGWGSQSHWSFFDAGPWGTTHQHYDKLHVSVHAYGRDILVDAGRYWYINDTWRAYFRGSQGHNVILINNGGQNANEQTVTSPITEYSVQEKLDFCIGNIAVFSAATAKHIRAVVYLRNKYWVVFDRIETASAATIDPLWHFHPDCTASVSGQQVLTTDSGKGNLRIKPISSLSWTVSLKEGQASPIQGWYSESYNNKAAAPCANYTASIPGTKMFAWLIYPGLGTVANPAATLESESNGVLHVKIDDGTPVDILVNLQGITTAIDLPGGGQFTGRCAVVGLTAQPIIACGAISGDTTPPSAPGTVNDGSGADIDSTPFTTKLSANWGSATDAESGISDYRYAIGTTRGATNVTGWTSVGNVLSVAKTGLVLSSGATYYFSVKAVNGSGVEGSAANSDGQVVTSTGTPAATVFSSIIYFGDSANYTPKTAGRWEVANESGDSRYFLNTSAYLCDGDKLGEYSLINDRTYGDFTMTLKAKTAENITSNTQADYAVVFGYQDSNNYYYLLANAQAASAQLFVVKNGARTALGTSSTALIPDTNWHDIELKRTGASITVKLDGTLKIGPVSNAVFSGGRAGIGSYNDSAYFDDVRVVVDADTTAPLPPSTVRDGTGATDIGSITSRTQLSANWPAGSDPESSISGYQYAIGTSAGGTQTQNWASIGNVLSYTKSGLSLVIGTTYYFGVKSVNEAGLISAAAYSNGQVVISTSAPDTTVPVGPSTVYDGSTSGVDAQSTRSQTSLSANWPAAADAQSGISGYRYAIGTIAGGTQTVDWTGAGLNRSVTRTGLTLTVGTTYYFSVKAVNGQGLEGDAVNSNGQYIEDNPDTTPPDTVIEVRDGTGSVDIDVIVTTATVDSITELSANWDAATDEESQIERYWYAIGTAIGGSDIVGWTTSGNSSAVTETGLTVAEGVEYYFSVKAENGAGLESDITSSDGLYISRQTTGGLEITGVQASAGTDSAAVTWNTNSPATSQAEYGATVSYGRMTPEETTPVSAHSVVITGLLPGTQYHFRVISEDALGNTKISSDYFFTTLSTPGGAAVNAYPNPCDLSRPGGMKFKVGAGVTGEVKIYTLTGKLVRKLSGSDTIEWNGTNDNGEKVARGIYIYKIIESDGDTVTGKIGVLK